MHDLRTMTALNLIADWSHDERSARVLFTTGAPCPEHGAPARGEWLVRLPHRALVPPAVAPADGAP